MEITASVHSRPPKRKKKGKGSIVASDEASALAPLSHNSRPAEERMWRHFFYYHYFRWLAHANGTTYTNPYPRFPGPASFASWEDYWRYFAIAYCQHISRKRLARDDVEEAELLPKLVGDLQEQQLQAWATWATAQSLAYDRLPSVL